MELIDFSKDVQTISDIGMVRHANEDNCFAAETPNGFLFVVCDGMGGHIGGAKASAIAVNSIVNFFTKEYYAVIHRALEDALLYANRQILDTVAASPELKGMGTTACVLLLRDDKAWFAHIGDSRIYLYCNDQRRLHRLTKDHSVVQGLVDQGIISETEAESHPNRNQILKTLGVKKEVQPEVCSMPAMPAKGDVFLICSDGLSNMVTDDILQHILQQKETLQTKGKNMLTLAKQAGGTDNITLQLIHVSNSPHQKSIFESKTLNESDRTDTSKKNDKRGILLIIAVGLLAITSILAFFRTSHDTTSQLRSEPVVMAEIPVGKAWERRADELGFKEELIVKDRKVFVKKLVYKQVIDAIIVENPNSDSYTERKIIFHNNAGTTSYTIAK